MNLFLLIITIIISFIIVRIGAIAFHMTGIKWPQAKFQSLSCFTGTGFTTREAELITGNTKRRRIATFLMILGNAGLVTIIATFANSIRPSLIMSKFSIPILHSVLPSFLIPIVNLLIIIIAIYLIYKIFTNAKISRMLTEILRKKIKEKDIIDASPFEELFLATGGYGISQIEVGKEFLMLDKTILESGLRKLDIMILAIERKGALIPNPPSGTKILLNDKLICFGKLENIKHELHIKSA
ncbi:cation:proton antiporter regulatory subunit [candidate division KSB1 bacterium]